MTNKVKTETWCKLPPPPNTIKDYFTPILLGLVIEGSVLYLKQTVSSCKLPYLGRFVYFDILGLGGVGHQHRGEQGRVRILHLHEPRTVRHLDILLGYRLFVLKYVLWLCFLSRIHYSLTAEDTEVSEGETL